MIAARLFFVLLTVAGIAGAVGNLPEPREAVLAWAVCAIASFVALMRDVSSAEARKLYVDACKTIKAQREACGAINRRLVEALAIVGTAAHEAQQIGSAESA